MTFYRLLLWCSLGALCRGAEASAARSIEVIPRSAWGARPVNGTCVPHTISHISVHHTATRTMDNTKSPKRLLGYQRYHQDNKGWVDLAYHLFIDLEGNVYEGRDVACVGDTSTNYDPSGHLLIVLEGNFEEQAVSPIALDRLIDVIAWGVDNYSVDLDRVRGHRDLAATACPGEQLYTTLKNGSLIERVSALRMSGSPVLRQMTAEQGAAAIHRIRHSETQ